MAKKKTIDKKDVINARGSISEKEELTQANAVMDGVKLIKQGIKVAAMFNKVAGGGGPGLLAILTMAFGDTIAAVAEAAGISRQEAMEDIFGLIRDYVNDDSHFEEKPDMDLN